MLKMPPVTSPTKKFSPEPATALMCVQRATNEISNQMKCFAKSNTLVNLNEAG